MSKHQTQAVLVIGAMLGMGFAAIHFAERPVAASRGVQLLTQLEPSVVRVQAMGASGGLLDQGSGVRLRTGWIATNYHVVRNAVSVRVLGQGDTAPAAIVRCSAPDDLCLLRQEGAAPRGPGVELADSFAPGEEVYALGAPEGIPSIISEGLVSGVRNIQGEPRLITSAAMSAGSSGGGLFDGSGALVGITTAQVSNGQDLNLAIPAGQIGKLVSGGGAAPAEAAREVSICVTDLGTTAAAARFREAVIDGLVAAGVEVEQDCDRATAELTGEVTSWGAGAGRLAMSYGIHLADSRGRVRRAWRKRRHGLPHALPAEMAAQLVPVLEAALKRENSVVH